MPSELVLSIPGPWADHRDFLRRVVTHEPAGRYLFAGAILADIEARDHVPVIVGAADPGFADAFARGARGAVPAELVDRLNTVRTILFLQFPLALPAQRARLLTFTQLIRQFGGMALKVESTGVSHTWEGWIATLTGTPFDLYAGTVTLVKGADHFYSCGMHLFGLPECELSAAVGVSEAADLMNRFNYWRILERPTLRPGETFSLVAGAPRFRLDQRPDSRHAPDDLFHNAHGVWRLQAA